MRPHSEGHFLDRIGWLRAAVLGWLAARAGGAKTSVSVTRVTFWGVMAMAITAGVGALFGAVV